ncbi:MAG: SCP2 sterol-binding domain-containing protein [Zoogloeaceae bacterium]|nr:SCP2 sterol-binding domain-containing protein [Zoogloeaceae bacterium]
MTFTFPALPEFHLPPFIKAFHQRLPQWPHSVALCLALNAGVRLGVLPAEAQTLCEGRTLCATVEDGGAEALFTCKNGVFLPLFSSAAPADVCFRGELHALLKLLTRQEDPDTLFFNRQLSIEGDTELGLAIKNLLDALEWPPVQIAELKDQVSKKFAALKIRMG